MPTITHSSPTYRSHKQPKHGAQSTAHDARHDCLARAGLHTVLHLFTHKQTVLAMGTVPPGEGSKRGWRTSFIICCSCSERPALGFMPGIPPGPPGKAIVVVVVAGGDDVEVVLFLRRWSGGRVVPVLAGYQTIINQPSIDFDKLAQTAYKARILVFVGFSFSFNFRYQPCYSNSNSQMPNAKPILSKKKKGLHLPIVCPILGRRNRITVKNLPLADLELNISSRHCV